MLTEMSKMCQTHGTPRQPTPSGSIQPCLLQSNVYTCLYSSFILNICCISPKTLHVGSENHTLPNIQDQNQELMNKQVQAGKAKNFSEAFDIVFSRPGASKFYFASWTLGQLEGWGDVEGLQYFHAKGIGFLRGYVFFWGGTCPQLPLVLVCLDIVSIQVVIVDTSSTKSISFESLVFPKRCYLCISTTWKWIFSVAASCEDRHFGERCSIWHLATGLLWILQGASPLFFVDQIPVYSGTLEGWIAFAGQLFSICKCKVCLRISKLRGHSGPPRFLYSLQQGFDFEKCWFHLISTIGTDGAEWWGVYASVPGALGFFGAWFVEACAIIRMKTCTHLRTHQ